MCGEINFSFHLLLWQLPRRAETVSLLVVMETVSPCAGDVMEMRTALVILMKRDV